MQIQSYTQQFALLALSQLAERRICCTLQLRANVCYRWYWFWSFQSRCILWIHWKAWEAWFAKGIQYGAMGTFYEGVVYLGWSWKAKGIGDRIDCKLLEVNMKRGRHTNMRIARNEVILDGVRFQDERVRDNWQGVLQPFPKISHPREITGCYTFWGCKEIERKGRSESCSGQARFFFWWWKGWWVRRCVQL